MITPKEFLTEAKVEAEEFEIDSKKLVDKNIKIFSSSDEEWYILSYYYSPEEGCMVLDIGKRIARLERRMIKVTQK